MGKAVLVMDMPECCNDCYAMNMSLRGRFCRAAEESLPVKAERPDWCPLRELPEKKDRNSPERVEYGNFGEEYIAGFNDCIDKILK